MGSEVYINLNEVWDEASKLPGPKAGDGLWHLVAWAVCSLTVSTSRTHIGAVIPDAKRVATAMSSEQTETVAHQAFNKKTTPNYGYSIPYPKPATVN